MTLIRKSMIKLMTIENGSLSVISIAFWPLPPWTLYKSTTHGFIFQKNKRKLEKHSLKRKFNKGKIIGYMFPGAKTCRISFYK